MPSLPFPHSLMFIVIFKKHICTTICHSREVLFVLISKVFTAALLSWCRPHFADTEDGVAGDGPDHTRCL